MWFRDPQRLSPPAIGFVAGWFACACGGLANSGGSSAADASDTRSLDVTAPSDSPAPEDGPSDAGTTDAARCDSGTITLVPANEASPSRIFVDSSNVYWNDQDFRDNYQGTLKRVSLCGGVPSTLLAPAGPGSRGVMSFVLDTTQLYAFVGGDSVGADLLTAPSSLVRLPLAGGAPSTLATHRSTLFDGLALNDTAVYWPNVIELDGGPMTARVCGFLGRPLSGGPPFEVALGGDAGACATEFYGLAADESRLYWIATQEDGGASYAILSMPLEGGAPATLAESRATPSALVVRAGTLYWLEPSGPGKKLDGKVMSVPTTGGTAVTLSSHVSPNSLPGALVVDDTTVYWTDWDGPSETKGRILEVPLTGGTPSTLLEAEELAPAIAVDATSVYWGGKNGLMRTFK